MSQAIESRAGEGLTRYELFPWLQVRASLAESRSFWLLVGIAVLSGILFAANDNPALLFESEAAVILVGYVIALRVFLRASMTLVALAGVFVLVVALMGLPLVHVPGSQAEPGQSGREPLIYLWLWFWKHFIPGEAIAQKGPLPVAWMNEFLSNLIAVGIPEDTFKLAPVGLFLALGAWLRSRAAKGSAAAARWAQRFDMSRPTTLLMTAFASAAAFVYMETVHQYVVISDVQGGAQVARVFQVLINTFGADNIAKALAGVDPPIDPNFLGVIVKDYGAYKGAELLLPRLLSFMMGHGAYAAIVAYGVILAQRHPRQWWLALGSAILLSAVLHAGWDTFASELAMVPIALATGFILLSLCIRVANLDLEAGYAPAPIVGESVVPRAARAPAATPPAPPAQAPPASPPPAAVAPPKPAEPARLEPPPSSIVGALAVNCAGAPPRTVLLRRAEVVAFTEEAKLDPELEGVSVDVVASPNDPRRLGLRNAGSKTLQVAAPDGREAALEPGRIVSLVTGARFSIGALQAEVTAVDA
ncbi:PrsW family glutamic-type intramembrane protease [Caulobacter sp. KR2-114]|uniref:PrsW family glutamic-type intramembrane protease n=1 Tax=Caulobacter sp. KR2-114 TaxID=3400912 RepID=UPI003BFE9FB2